MKKIEATIQINKVGAVSDAINDIVGGFTVLEGNGRGSGKRQSIRSERGTVTMTAEYNKVAIISTIVDDLEVEKVSKAIVDAVFTGEEGDGIISISNIENVLNIASKKKDLEAL
ncbi:P-II family nitrogen regulator [Nitrosopumilus sp.]|nr:P-II family nitrogen regulator [Nitrosopumilus sp.]